MSATRPGALRRRTAALPAFYALSVPRGYHHGHEPCRDPSLLPLPFHDMEGNDMKNTRKLLLAATAGIGAWLGSGGAATLAVGIWYI